MKITMYELLGMVRDDKAPKRIKFENFIYIWRDTQKDYFCERINHSLEDIIGEYLFNNLNLEVEILEEEKKIKVGDYVRFDYHRVSIPIQIAKITEIHYDSENDSVCYSTDVGLVISESNLVTEPSPDIIDLIQKGDFINGDQILMVEVSKLDGIKRAFNCEYETCCYKNETIKSVVTKEQFESMEYKIGEQ